MNTMEHVSRLAKAEQQGGGGGGWLLYGEVQFNMGKGIWEDPCEQTDRHN